MTDKYFRLVHAKEEIVRLDVEYRRLRTWIRDAEALFRAYIEQQTHLGNVSLCAELAERFTILQRDNEEISRWLDRAAALPGFSGQTTCRTALKPEQLPAPIPIEERRTVPEVVDVDAQYGTVAGAGELEDDLSSDEEMDKVMKVLGKLSTD